MAAKNQSLVVTVKARNPQQEGVHANIECLSEQAVCEFGNALPYFIYIWESIFNRVYCLIQYLDTLVDGHLSCCDQSWLCLEILP